MSRKWCGPSGPPSVAQLLGRHGDGHVLLGKAVRVVGLGSKHVGTRLFERRRDDSIATLHNPLRCWTKRHAARASPHGPRHDHTLRRWFGTATAPAAATSLSE